MFQHTSYNLSRRPVCQYKRLSDKVIQHTSYNLSRRPVCQYTRRSHKWFVSTRECLTKCFNTQAITCLEGHAVCQYTRLSRKPVGQQTTSLGLFPCTRHEWPGLEPGGDKTVAKLSGCRSQRGSRVLFAAPYIDSPRCRIKGLAFEISAVFGTPVFVVTPGKDAMLGFLRLLCSLQR